MTLKYNRRGFVPGIPARDLTDEEVEKYGGEEFLVSRGIYELPKTGGVIVNQYFAGAKINVTQEDTDKLEADEIPAGVYGGPKEEKKQAPETKSKREIKKADWKQLAKDG